MLSKGFLIFLGFHGDSWYFRKVFESFNELCDVFIGFPVIERTFVM